MGRTNPRAVELAPWEDAPDTGPDLGDDLDRTQAKIEEVVLAYPSRKPAHREVLTRPIEFCVGRFLHQLVPRYLGGNTAALGAPGEALGALPWFREWLEGLQAQRRRASFEEEVLLLVDAYPTRQPGRGDTLRVERANGEMHTLVPRIVLEKLATRIARDHPGDSSKKHRGVRLGDAPRARFEALPWAAAWRTRCRQACGAAGIRKVISKEAKMELLLSNCRTACPRWEQVVPVCGPGIGHVYRWRPYTWLDDIADNWLESGGRPGVVLNAAQMRAIESLDWTSTWLGRIEALRARKSGAVGKRAR